MYFDFPNCKKASIYHYFMTFFDNYIRNSLTNCKFAPEKHNLFKNYKQPNQNHVIIY